MWFFVDRIWAPPLDIHFSDLYPSWYGSRELLLHGRDPYSPAVNSEIQAWRPGHDPHEVLPLSDYGFFYPPYVALLLWPTIAFSFPTVVIIFRAVLPIVVGVTAVLWIFALRWQISPPLQGTLVLLTLGSFPFLECIYLQQPGLFAGLFLAASVAFLTHGHLKTAGMFLAFATLKPQLVILFVLWLILWSLSDVRQRWPLLASFTFTMLLLLGFSQVLVPRWLPEFLEGISRYHRLTGNRSILSLLFSSWGGDLVTTLLIAGLCLLAWESRHEPTASDRFVVISCLTLTITVLVIPVFYITSHMILVPGLYFLLKKWHSTPLRAQKLSTAAVVAAVAWTWLGAVTFSVLGLVLPLKILRAIWLLPLSTLPMMPLLLTAALAIHAYGLLHYRNSKFETVERAVSKG